VSLPTTLRWFQAREFRHPALVDAEAARFLDAVRDTYGAPLVLTSDARTPEENAAAQGSSPTSLHLHGRAFDLRWIPDPEALWRLVDAVYLVAGTNPVELELVNSQQDQHIHLACLPTGRVSRLLIRAD